MRRIAVVLITLAIACGHRSELPKLFPIPDTVLVDEHGKKLDLASMKGHVTVYDFIFTRCAGTCPVMTQTMRRIAHQIPDDAPVRFVSITVDPERDTPAVLHEYARRVRNDPRWIFAGGDRATITKLSIDGFKLAAAGSSGSASEPIIHSSKLAIADKEGVIREYYGALEEDAAAHVVGTINDLLRE